MTSWHISSMPYNPKLHYGVCQCGHLCTHTADPTHARNGVTFDAENDSRFEEDNRYWWEKEVNDDGRNESTDQGDGQGNS